MELQQNNQKSEEKRLEETITLAKRQLEQARQSREIKKAEIIEAKKELRENTSHSVPSLWSSDGFEALAELNQYANPVTDKIIDCEDMERKIELLESLIKCPYFARIDFQFDDEDTLEEIYIGRTSLKKDTAYEMSVYDWRSPIASVFYRFMTGPAYYDAPAGRIDGTLSLKRQYEIRKEKLLYYFDADVQIIDEFLRKLLSQNSSTRMKTIIETIQKEQDLVIRDMENDLMMVQGVAGSGKTSIALHRAAYLMYQDLSSKLSANDIMVLSPNPLFEQYISDVLPELGESNVLSAVFEDILSLLLPQERVQSRNRFLEILLTTPFHKEIMKRSIEFKTSLRFVEILNRFITDLPFRFIPFEDIRYNGKLILKKETLQQKITGRQELSLGVKLEQLEDFILARMGEYKGKRLKKAEEMEIRDKIKKFTKPNLRELYKVLFTDKTYFAALADDPLYYKSIEDLIILTQENLASSTLQYDDASALAYLHAKVHGAGMYKKIKQVVIDEAQDYYPLQYELFRLLFPQSKFTILGDMNQTLEKQKDLSLYEEIQNILKKKKAVLVTMDKSFRCTHEILQYSLKFIDHRPDIKSFNRNGDAPVHTLTPDIPSLCNALLSEIKICRKKGYESIGLICKTEKNARTLYHALKDKIDLQFITNESTSDPEGTFLIPVYMSKGLEFDAVLICDVDAQNYTNEDDKKLLYISCTRALHRLNLFGVETA